MDEQAEEEELTNEELSREVLDKILICDDLKKTKRQLKNAMMKYNTSEANSLQLQFKTMNLEEQIKRYEKGEHYIKLQESYNTLQAEYNDKVNKLHVQYQEAHKALEKVTAERDKLKEGNIKAVNDGKKKQQPQKRKNNKTSKVTDSEEMKELANKYKDVERSFKEKQRECGALRDELDSLSESYTADKSKLENELSSLKVKLSYVEKIRNDLHNDKERMSNEMRTLQEEVKQLKLLLPCDINIEDNLNMPVLSRDLNKETKDVNIQTDLDTSLKKKCDDLQNQINLLKSTHKCEVTKFEKDLNKKEREIENMRLLESKHLEEIQNLTLENNVLKEQTTTTETDMFCRNSQSPHDLHSDLNVATDEDEGMLETNLLHQSFNQNLCNKTTPLQEELSIKGDTVNNHLETIKVLKNAYHEEIKVLNDIHHQRTETLKNIQHMQKEEMEILKSTHRGEMLKLTSRYLHEIDDLKSEMQAKEKELNNTLDWIPVNNLVEEMKIPRPISPLSNSSEIEFQRVEVCRIDRRQSVFKEREQLVVNQNIVVFIEEALKKFKNELSLELRKTRRNKVRRVQKARRQRNTVTNRHRIIKKTRHKKLTRSEPSEVTNDLAQPKTDNNPVNQTESYDSLYEKPQGSVDSGCAVSKFFSSSEDEDEAVDKDKGLGASFALQDFSKENVANRKRKTEQFTEVILNSTEVSLPKSKKGKLDEQITENNKIQVITRPSETINNHNQTRTNSLKPIEAEEITKSDNKIGEIPQSDKTIKDHNKSLELPKTKSSRPTEPEKATKGDNRIGKTPHSPETIEIHNQTSKLSQSRSIIAEKTKPVEKITGSNNTIGGIPQSPQTIDGQNKTSKLTKPISSKTIKAKTAKSKTTEDEKTVGGIPQSPETIDNHKETSELLKPIEAEKAKSVEEIIESEDITIAGVPESSETTDSLNQTLKLLKTKSSKPIEAEKTKPAKKITESGNSIIGDIPQSPETIDYHNKTSKLTKPKSSKTIKARQAKSKTTESDDTIVGIPQSPETIDNHKETLELPKPIEAEKAKSVEEIIESEDITVAEVPKSSGTTDNLNQTKKLLKTKSPKPIKPEAEKAIESDNRIEDTPHFSETIEILNQTLNLSQSTPVEAEKAKLTYNISECNNRIEEIPQLSKTIDNHGQTSDLVQNEKTKSKGFQSSETKFCLIKKQINKKVINNARYNQLSENILMKVRKLWQNKSISSRQKPVTNKASVSEISVDNEPPAKRTRRALSSSLSKPVEIIDDLGSKSPNKLSNKNSMKDDANKKIVKVRNLSKDVPKAPQTSIPNVTVTNAKKLSDEQIALRKKSAELLKVKVIDDSDNKNENIPKKSFKRPNRKQSAVTQENTKTETCDNFSSISNVGNIPEIFESPLSPEPEPFNEDIIKIIPLEKTREKSHPKIFSSEEEDKVSNVKEVPVDEMMEKQLLYLLQFWNSKGAKEDTAKFFLDKPAELTARTMMRILLKDQHNKAIISGYKQGPLLTTIQESLLDLMMALEARGVKNIMNCFLGAVEQTIFWLNNIDRVEPYARLHVAICLKKYYYTRMRCVLCKALTIMPDDIVIPYVYIVIRSWPKLIPCNDNTKLGPYDMLEVRALMHAIQLKTCKRAFSNACRTNLMDLLNNNEMYNFKKDTEDTILLLKELFAAYLKGISEGITYLTTAICKKTNKHAVLNLINEFKPQLIRANDIHEICPVLRLIGLVTCLCAENKTVAHLVNSNKEFLKQYCTDLYPAPVRELAVEILSNLTND